MSRNSLVLLGTFAPFFSHQLLLHCFEICRSKLCHSKYYSSVKSKKGQKRSFLILIFCYWYRESLIFKEMYYLREFVLKNKWKWKRQTSWEKSSRDGSKKGSFISVWNVLNALNNLNLPCIQNILISSKIEIPLNIISFNEKMNWMLCIH